MLYKIIEQFRNAMVATGITPPNEIHTDGKKHRFSTNGKTNDMAGEYCIHMDSIPAGYFKDYRSGIYQPWCLDKGSPYTAQENLELKEAQKRRKEQEQLDEEAASKKAQQSWDAASVADPNHGYLITKGIKPIGLRMDKGCLLVPIMQGEKLYSLQSINKVGEKRFMPDGRIHGAYFPIGHLKEIICICEGAATGISIHEATGYAVAAALSCGNLPAVAQYIRNEMPTALMLICCDDDASGLKYAKQAAELVNGRLVIPVFDENRPEKANDFNDMATLYRLDKVKTTIDEACKVTNISSSEEEWPQIIPLDTLNLPRLNLDHLPSWAGDFARALSESTETPPELAASQILAVCATAAARRLKVRVTETYYEYCNLWIIAALPPGNRKSSVHTHAVQPLNTWEMDQKNEMEPQIKQLVSEHKTMQARITEKRKLAAKAKDHTQAKICAREIADLELALPKIPGYPQLWVSDSTPEKLGVLLEDNDECMAWLSAEGGLFDLLQGRYSNNIPNLDLILKCHSGDAEKITRLSRESIFLKKPLLSIGLSPQPAVLNGLAEKPGFSGRGLLARFLYLLPPSLLGYRTLNNPPIPKSISDAYTMGVYAMLNWEPASCKAGEKAFYELHISTEAYSQYQAFAHTIEKHMQPKGALEHATDWGGKAPGATIRLAGILHSMLHAHNKPWEHEISNETMANAIELMIVFTGHSLAAFNIMGADPIMNSAQKVLDWIKSRKLERFTTIDALRGLRGGHGLKRKKQVEEALKILEERGHVLIEEPPPKVGRGRPASPMVRVNPKTHEEVSC